MFGRADGDAGLGRGRAAGFLPAARRGRAGLQQEPGQTLQEPPGTPQGAETKVSAPCPPFHPPLFIDHDSLLLMGGVEGGVEGGAVSTLTWHRRRISRENVEYRPGWLPL